MLSRNELIDIYAQDRWAQRIGTEITTLTDTHIELHLPFRQQNMNLGGRMHGGVIGSILIDSAKLLAQAYCEKDSALSFRLVDFQINYFKAGGPEPLKTVATVTRKTREFLFARCEIYNQQNETLAAADVLIRIYTPSAIPAPTRHQQGDSKKATLVADEIAKNAPNYHLVEIFNNMMAPIYPGSYVHYMSEGYAEMTQEDFPDQYDYQGNISAGQLLLFFDNVSGCSGGSLAEEFGMAVTLTIQASFCEPARNENLIGTSKAYYREDGMTNNEVHIYGAETGHLKMFGTMTHLARSLRKK